MQEKAVENILRDSFGENTQINLFARGSKHHIKCQTLSRQTRIEKDVAWRTNIF